MTEVYVNGVRYVTNEEGWFVPYVEPEPRPEIPPEVWHTTAFDSAQAWNATLAACRGQR
jgi:hypothetical protein